MSCAVGIAERVAHSNVPCDDKSVERCEVVTDVHRLEELSLQWKRLWETDPRAEIFQTPEWSRAWWRAFGKDYSLCCPVVFAGDQVIGILPLVQRNHVLRFLGTPEADYGDVICEESRASEVLALALETLLESVSGWKECAFRHLSKHSRLVRYYDYLPGKIRNRLHLVPAERQHTIIFRNQREAIFKALLGKQHTRRLQNKLRKAGQLQFRHVETQREIERYLPDFFRHHVRRHAAVGRRSACATPEFRQFVRGVIQELGPDGRVRFGVLELDERPLAWELGFHVNGKFLLYQHTFDLNSSHYTPGEVLLWNALDYAKDHVAREFDFGKGDELYKDRFANYSRETYSLFLEPVGQAGTLRGFGRSLQAAYQPGLWKVKEAAKSERTAMRVFRSIRMWMLGTWGCVQQARKNGALFQYGVHLIKETFGNSIWSKRSTDVFAAEASTPGNEACSVRDPDYTVCSAQLGDLVDLAWEHPEILSLTELPECRRRLKAGDGAYVVREGLRPVIVSWVSTGANYAPKAGGQRPELTEPTPALEVEELWSARGRDNSAAYSALLSCLATEAGRRRNPHLLVHCGSDQPQLRRELERHGFAPLFHATRYRILSRYRRDSISQCVKETAHSSEIRTKTE